VAGIGTIVFRTREPHADGHPLSHWLQLGSEQDANDLLNNSKQANEEANSALRKIGVGAVPILLQKLRVTDPKWRGPAIDWMNKQFGLSWDSSRAEHEWAQAQYGFRILGTQAIVAIPQLTQMLFNTNTLSDPASALAQLGPEATPAIRAALTNANLEICSQAILAAASSRDIGQQIIPELTALASSTDRIVTIVAAMQLRNLLPLEEFVRVAVRASGPNQRLVHRVMLHQLAETKTNVAFAVPVVVSLLGSSDRLIAELATNTLVQIDPITAITRGIDTNPPPAGIPPHSLRRQRPVRESK